MESPLTLLAFGLITIGLMTALFWPEKGMIARWQRTRRMTGRVRQEDALKHIQKQEFDKRPATLQSIAGSLGMDINQAARTISQLEELGLARHDGEIIRLTHQGRQVAMNVIRAHRLWEQYLAEQTGYKRSEWHTMAEAVEHEFSSEELDRLAGSLGNPLYDPHGDPIPSREGDLFEHKSIPLNDLEQDQFALIVHVEDEPEMVAAQIEAEGLLPGMVVRLSESTANRVRFWTDGEEHLLAPIVASRISVQPMDNIIEQPEPHSGQYLSELDVGQSGRVVKLLPQLRGQERRRLMDLGILPGTVVKADLSSPLGDPVAYRVRDALIALRADQARHIQIEKILDKVLP